MITSGVEIFMIGAGLVCIVCDSCQDISDGQNIHEEPWFKKSWSVVTPICTESKEVPKWV